MPHSDSDAVFHKYDINEDGGVNVLDAQKASSWGYNPDFIQDIINYSKTGTIGDSPMFITPDPVVIIEDDVVVVDDEVVDDEIIDTIIDKDFTKVTGIQSMPVSQVDLGVSTAAVGSRKELGRMLESYKSRKSLIQTAIRQKAIFTIDRFDGGLNQNAAPRDIAYFEACQLDCLSPAKAGRLVKLGDFGTKITTPEGASGGLALLVADSVVIVENYGLHYFKWSNDSCLDASGTPTNYIAIQDGNDINIWDLHDDSVTANVITSLQDTSKPVFHNASNRVYVSDASFNASVTSSYMFGIVDRRKLFPFDSSGTLTYNITGDSQFFKNQSLYHAAPVKGIGSGQIMVVGTQANETNAIGGQHLPGFSADKSDPGGGYPGGIYINTNFETITGDESNSIGWGSSESNAHTTVPGTGTKYYKFYASWLYDDGSETKLTGVSASDNTNNTTVYSVKATTGEEGEYQKMIIKQVLIDGVGIVAALPRVHGARFYYDEVNEDGDSIGNDKYLWAELDFRYGFKLVSEFGHWNPFEDDNGTTDGSTASDTQSIQVLGAANSGVNTDTGTSAFGTLSIITPPQAFTYYALNLFHQEEIKDDLMWKTSTVGNGIAFVGNVKYDGREYPDTMLYSGAGETDAGSAYPMWGTFPVDSNRIDIPGAAGEITALKWTSGKVLQFRKNAVHVVDVTDVLSPSIDASYQGMGVHGQFAVTETPFGCAWVNDNGVYAYNVEEGKARSLTLGRLDAEDFQSGLANLDKTKIGYDDRAKMLIITNTANVAADGYHYAYSFVTNAWCTWNANKAHAANVTTNFAIDHDGYLTGADNDGSTDTTLNVHKWSAEASVSNLVTYVTKDFDFGKPNLDKRFYTLYISYTGGSGHSDTGGGLLMQVYFRVNGLRGDNLAAGWTALGTVTDYTNPYGTTSTTPWADSSGSPTTGDPVTSDSDGLSSSSTGEKQKLAKINLRHLSGSFPTDYFKFARSIQFKIYGKAAMTFEINDISLVFKEKRIK